MLESGYVALDPINRYGNVRMYMLILHVWVLTNFLVPIQKKTMFFQYSDKNLIFDAYSH